MQPATLFCVLVFTTCWVIYVQSKEICGKDQYTVTYSNGSFYKCLNCATCHPGYGLYPPCGTSVTYPANNIDCERCPNGTFSDTLDSAPCHICQDCVEHEIIAAPCALDSDRKCNGTCEKGYFFAKKAPHDCQQCSYCCFDRKDDEQTECIKQGLNATGRHCSGRLDKQCGPPSTTPVTITVTHSPPVTHPSSQHQNTTSSGLDNVISPTHPSSKHYTAAIVLSVLSGLFLAALVVGAILYQRKSRVWRRKRVESIPTSVQIHFEADDRGPNATQGNNDNNASHSLESAVDPRIQALQNTGYTETPEVSPSATPQQTDDEIEDLPDVIAVRKKRVLKRQSSKDAQSNRAPNNDGANVNSLDSKVDIQAPNDGNFKGQDSKVGGQTKPRKASLEAVLKRKLSFSQEKEYQLLGEEDPDEPQGNGETRSKSRSGSIIGLVLKRKFSLPGKEQNYQPVRGEDPDEDQSDCKNFSTTCNEPVKINVEPMRQREKEGSRVEFKCIVQGKSELSYQWIKDGNTEIQGQNDSSLVLSSVELRDFGHYACQVSFADSDCKISSAAMLDVDPRDGMVYRYLSDVHLDTKTKVGTLLTKAIQGLGGWKQVADKYKMDKDDIDSLEGNQDAGKEIISYLKATNPDLTVYEFCKTLKERNIRRFDIIKELLSQLSVPAPEGNT